MVALGRSIPLLVLVKIVVLTFFTSAQCDVGCPVLVPSVCLQVTCQNLTRTGPVDCLNPGAFIPQGTIATYRCIPHRGKQDGNRTYTMMCICDGKWMGIDRFLRFRDWCSGSTDTGPFVEDTSESGPIPPEDLMSMSTSENARFLGGETTNPSVTSTTLKFLETVSTGFPLATTTGSELATTTPQSQPTTGTGAETTTVVLGNTTGSGAEAGTTTTIQPGTGTGSTPTPASGAGHETTTPNTLAVEGSNATGTTPSAAAAAGTGTTGFFPISTGIGTGEGESTTPTSANTVGQTTEAAGQGTTTSSEGLTTLPPSAAGNVSSENMVQGKNNSREGEGRSLFEGTSNTTTSGNGTEATPSSSGETATPATGTTTGAETVKPTTEQPGAATATPAVISGTGSTSPPIASGEITTLPSTSTPSVEGSTTTGTSFTVTTHEPPTVSPEEAGTGNETGAGTTPPPSIQVTTTIAALTTTEAPETATGTQSPVAPPEKLQQPDNSTTAGSNKTSSNTSSEISSAPSPGEANCGEDHTGEGANYTDFQLVGLELHNKYRRMHNVSDVKLNQTLNERAQEWAEHELTEKTLQVTPGKRNYAENLYKVSGWRAITPVRAVQEAMKTWYSSVDRYNWAQPNPTGFSQIVWKTTSDIGVGVAKKDDVTVVAVTYWPRGNIILVSSNGNQTVDSGKLFRENVFPKVAE